MPKVNVTLNGGFYESESLPISAQNCVNAYVNIPQTATITDASIFGTPGLDELVSVSDTDTSRGKHEMAGLPYDVIGNTLYRLDRTTVLGVVTYSTTTIGTIDGTGPVSMDDGNSQLVIVAPGVKAYTYTVADGLNEITDPNFAGPVNSGQYSKGLFTFVKTDGREFINSPVGDARGIPNGLPYNALDTQVAEADPDDIRAQVFLGSTLYMLGSITTEGFDLTSRVPAPFIPIKGAVFNTGIDAPFSIVEARDTFTFIGSGDNETPAVWSFNGNGFDKLSTTAIDNILADLTDNEMANVTGWYYAEKGAYFIGFSLPDTCIVYDFVSKRWHERQSTVENQQVTYRAVNMVTAYGGVLVGDKYSGKIGRLERETYNEYGELIHRHGVLRYFDNLGDSVGVPSFEFVMEAGVGNVDVPDPQMRISISKDGGRNFSEEVARSFGKIGEYGRRVIWDRVLGAFPRSGAIGWAFSEQAKMVIVKAEALIG